MISKENILDFDVVIVGSGGAGLMAAISCLENGVKKVAVVSKVFPTSSHTVAAKGGINAALGNVDEDNWQWHAFDTIKSSDYLADEDAVNYMCKNAAQAIIDLEHLGVVFSRLENGKIYQRAYGGQSKDFGKGGIAHRACSAKDATGHAILHSLYQKALADKIIFFNEYLFTDLLIDDKSNGEKSCLGIVAIDLNEARIVAFRAKSVILATGGFSQVYQNSTSATICTGDGGGAVLRCGLQLQDMEFVQFHPTGLSGKNLLITEAARGEGGYLVNGNGERFMERYSPQFLDLAPRDVVARAIATEIKEGRGCGVNKDYVHLKIDHLGKKLILERLPGLYDLVRSFANIDPCFEPIPVVPLAHYSMGGIATNVDCQIVFFDGDKEEKVRNLFAVGEAACLSVHGANRMGCNSLLDIVVFGKKAGEIVAKNLSNITDFSNFDPLLKKNLAKITDILAQNPAKVVEIEDIKKKIQSIMSEFAGIFRDESMLNKAIQLLKDIVQDLKSVKIKNKSLFFNDDLINYFETENLLYQALAVVYCALSRVESRGSHFRNDFPFKDDANWQFHSLISINLDKLSFEFKKKSVRKIAD